MANPPVGIIGEALPAATAIRGEASNCRASAQSLQPTGEPVSCRGATKSSVGAEGDYTSTGRLNDSRALAQRQHAEARPVGGGESKRIGATLADVVDVDTGDETHQLARHLRFLEPVNATRRANRQITDACVRKHRKRHFDLQAPAAAVWRRVLEQRAAESQGGIVIPEGTGLCQQGC